MDIISGVSSVGIPGLLASICVLMTLQVLGKVAAFLWRIKEKKDELSEATVRDLTLAVRSLDERLKSMEKTMLHLDKMSNDLKRLFHAVKNIAGDNWDMIRREIMNEFPY